MENVFRLNASPYSDVNAIHVYVRYGKREGGYVIEAEPIHCYFDGNLAGRYSKLFGREYYQHDGDGVAKVFPCGRRSAKREAEAEEYCNANALDIAEKYLSMILHKLNITDDIHILKEV